MDIFWYFKEVFKMVRGNPLAEERLRHTFAYEAIMPHGHGSASKPYRKHLTKYQMHRKVRNAMAFESRRRNWT